MMKKFRRKQAVILVQELENGDRVVKNEGDTNEYVISKDVFESTYIEVEDAEDVVDQTPQETSDPSTAGELDPREGDDK